MLFKRQVLRLTGKKIQELFEKSEEEILSKATNNTLTPKSTEATFCHNCLRILRSKKIPSISVNNGLFVDPIPEELQLTDLEEQFIARSLIFMKVVKLPKSRMSAVKDRIINVPMTEDDVSKTVSSLPRPLDAAGLIPVKLKRKMEMKTYHVEEYVNPNKCIDAVKKLKEIGNPFYQNISVDENFHQQVM